MSLRQRLRRQPVDRIDVLTNLNAGKGKNRTVGTDTRSKLVEVFTNSGSDVQHRYLETEDLKHLDRVIDGMLLHPPSMIIVIGGDGTAQKTIDRIIKKFQAACAPMPMIMILGAGTVNAIRNAYQLLGPDPEKGRDAVFKKIRRGEQPDVIHRSILKVSGKDGFLEHGFIVGLGLPVRFLERYYRYDPPRGFVCAARASLRILVNELLRLVPFLGRRSIADRFPVEYELWSDDQLIATHHERFSGVVMASVEQIGLGCKLTARALEEPGHFHAVLSRMGIARTLLNVPSMFLGASLKGPALSEVVTKVVLRFDEPLPLMIDGEMYSAEEIGRTLTVERGPTLDIIRS